MFNIEFTYLKIVDITQVLWVNPGGQLGTTQPLAYFPVIPSGTGEEERKNKSKKTWGSRSNKQTNNCLISEG